MKKRIYATLILLITCVPAAFAQHAPAIQIKEISATNAMKECLLQLCSERAFSETGRITIVATDGTENEVTVTYKGKDKVLTYQLNSLEWHCVDRDGGIVMTQVISELIPPDEEKSILETDTQKVAAIAANLCDKNGYEIRKH